MDDFLNEMLIALLDWDLYQLIWTVAVLGLLLIFLYWLIYVPLHLEQDLGEIKRYNLPGKGQRIKSRRWNIGGSPPKYPPPFPNGWYGIASSVEIKKENIKSVDAFGTKLAVFRSAQGVVHVLDAFCPHLGANIAIGGTVRGDCVECPFHHWSFNGNTGQCVNIAYNTSDQIPKSAKLNKWISREQNGIIFVWYHAENEEPWHLPKVDEIDNGDWVYHGGNELYINCHIQEVPENGADSAHLQAVHGRNVLTGSDVGQKESILSLLGHHVWRGTWRQSAEEDQKHLALSEISHSINLFNKFNLFQLSVTAEQLGPAYVQLRFKTNYGPFIILQTLCPVGPLIQKVVHRVYLPRKLFFVAKIVIWAETAMIKRDMLMWNNKNYLDSPCLVKDDKFIKGYRQWFKQFYSPNSISYKDSLETLEW